MTAETCPHYLTLAAEEIRDGATLFKCAPPIRERENRERLWQGLARGDIDFIVSDHSPCTPHLKHLDTGDFGDAWGGISSLQFSLPILWTQMQKRGLGVKELTRWLCEAPAQFAGLHKHKGAIQIGMDADFVLWNPLESFKLESSMIQHRHSISPYIGQTFKGVVKTTIVRGRKVYDNGEFTHDSFGHPVLRRNS